MSEPLAFNPFSYEMHEDPYPTYERLREEAPCYHNEEMAFWVLSRFDDVLEGYRDWENFTSTKGVSLEEVGTDSAPSMIGMDPPRQTQLRKPRQTQRQTPPQMTPTRRAKLPRR